MPHDTVIQECASCDKVAPTYDVGAYDATRFCRECIKKFGALTLEKACNAALAARETPKHRATCIRCQAPLLVGSGLMCSSCNSVYQERFGKKVKWL